MVEDDLDLQAKEDYLEALESLKDLLKEPGWGVFREQVLDYQGEQWARALESEDRSEMIRVHQGGIRFYRQLMSSLESLTDNEMEALREEIKEMKENGQEDA